ncbi:hypothetical protein [Geomesophilobacter sediminis]|uniref:Uncharacterized protein n=1 Tax=Geomesophilobacter sediminis TaxID=2798584 RepID=A0A8J7M2T3_9BACT|nr:hypothetical protein [Geomesophilobacter sediminis]MBJ6727587.1 hypothetical protein [Geomesophilobacter sediminis]
MSWTQEKPVAAGKYWYVAGGTHHSDPRQPAITIVAIRPDANGNLVALQHGVEGSIPIETLNGKWYGPLEPPRG